MAHSGKARRALLLVNQAALLQDSGKWSRYLPWHTKDGVKAGAGDGKRRTKMVLTQFQLVRRCIKLTFMTLLISFRPCQRTWFL